MSGASVKIVYLRVEHDGEESLVVAPLGSTLRDVLCANDISPYTRTTERLNCGGRGLCATCGVRFVYEESSENGGRNDPNGNRGTEDEPPAPEHWHDSLAARFDYPRLSCQIDVEGDMNLEIPEKIVWGSRRVEHATDGKGGDRR